jgi:glutathionyl-hydroquinone reductase
MFVIVPFLRVRFNDHSAREILYACPWANKLMLIRTVKKITDKRDLVFIFICFKNVYSKLMKRIEELTQLVPIYPE